MHSHIIQIALIPIDKENYLNEDTIETGTRGVDYTAEISDQTRLAVISNLVNSWLPKGMFSLGDELDTIIYNGGLDEWTRREWLPKIKKAAQNLSTHNIFKSLTLFRMEKLMKNALDLGTLFYLSDENYQGYAEESTAFLEFVNTLGPGTTLYVGGVLDYHY